MNTLKDGYLWVVDFIDAHPHVAFWAVVALAVLVVIT